MMEYWSVGIMGLEEIATILTKDERILAYEHVRSLW